MAFDISQQVKVVNPTANVDYYYGTYASTSDACIAVPETIRKQGKTVGILTDNGVVEYWWKNGIENKDLNVKGGQGPKGENGKDGYTPVKGTDYFTDADKQEFITELTPTIENMINQAIGEIEYGTY